MSRRDPASFNPKDLKLNLSVPGGLLDLLHRVQNGEASCMYGATLIEYLHERELDKVEAQKLGYTKKTTRKAFKPHWDRKPISIDFDGVVHAFSKGYCQVDIYDPPMPGAEEALTRLIKDYAVHILSARDAREVIDWCRVKFPKLRFALIPKDAPYWQTEGIIGVTNTKLPSLHYVDDRALRFTNWQDITKYFL